MSETVCHCGALWVWTSGQAPASWHFLTLDGAEGEAIAAHALLRRLENAGRARGFGSVRVSARIGATSWATSVFPDKAQGGYLLPVKAAVRRAEGLAQGDRVSVELTLA